MQIHYFNPLENLEIDYGFHKSPFGDCLIAISSSRICHISFLTSEDKEVFRKNLEKEWKGASFRENPKKTEGFLEKIFQKGSSCQILLKGTPFQIEIWKELLNIPRGQVSYYEKVAEKIGKKSAVRAVASAIANNRIAFLIPCHRVITKSGKIHRYRWGSETKKTLLDWEASFL